MKLRLKILLFAVSTVTVIAFQDCGGFKSSDTDSSSSSQNTFVPPAGTTGIEEFQTGLYAFANTQGCVACHAASVAPFFASTDLATAYAQAKTVVNFASPTTTLFIAYSGNNHCSVAACEDSNSPAIVANLISEWADVENEATSTGTGTTATTAYVTATVQLPATIPTVTSATTPTVIDFKLSGLQPAVSSLSAAIFQLEVQMDNATTYKFSNPRIGGNTAAVTIGGIHIFIRPMGTTSGVGTEGVAPANAWDSLTGLTAAVFAITSTSPTTPIGATALTTQPLYVQKQSSADSITIGFDTIQ